MNENSVTSEKPPLHRPATPLDSTFYCEEPDESADCNQKSAWLFAATESWSRAKSASDEVKEKLADVLEILSQAKSIGFVCDRRLSVETSREVVKLAARLNAAVYTHSTATGVDWERLSARYSRHSCTLGEARTHADLICIAGMNDISTSTTILDRLVGKNNGSSRSKTNPTVISWGSASHSETPEEPDCGTAITVPFTTEFIQQVRFAIRKHREKPTLTSQNTTSLNVSSGATQLANLFANKSYVILVLDLSSQVIGKSEIHQLLKLTDDLRPDTRLHLLTMGDKAFDEVCSWNGIESTKLIENGRLDSSDDVLIFVGDHRDRGIKVCQVSKNAKQKILIGQYDTDCENDFDVVIPTPMDGTTEQQTFVRFDGVPIYSSSFLAAKPVTTTAEILKNLSTRLPLFD